jgi:monoamine oxidase
MFGPDFPFGYDEFLKHGAGLGSLSGATHGTEVAIIGAGIAGMVAAYELMKLGLKPVIFEADRIGGRMRSQPFVDGDGAAITTALNAVSGVIRHLSTHGRPCIRATWSRDTQSFTTPRSSER